jgi:outer membrane protein assembly factor BamA
MRRLVFLVLLSALVLFGACNTYKYVPKGSYLLRSVRLVKGRELPKDVDYSIYLQQVPNQRFLGLFGLNLFFYNLSGRDTSKWVNRKLRGLGEEPAVFEADKSERSRKTLENLLVNEGFYGAEVTQNVTYRGRDAHVTFRLKGNTPYTIRSYTFDAKDDTISHWVQQAMSATDIRPGMALNTDKLDLERVRLVKYLQTHGFYAMQKDNLYFSVDSALQSNAANVTLKLRSFLNDTSLTTGLSGKELMLFNYGRYRVRNVYFMLGVDMSSYNRRTSGTLTDAPVFALSGYDTLYTDGYRTVYKGKPFIAPEALIQNCRIVPGKRFDATMVERSYSRLNSLQYMKYVNIRFAELPADSLSGDRPLDCYIILSPNPKQGLGFDVEGTNTAGDFGVAGNASYTHRNLFNGSELFQIKLRGAYEALSTSFNSDYTELGGEMNVTLPEFKMPFLKADFKQRVDANTEYRMAYQLMSRPEFERTVASLGVRYNWSQQKLRQTIDLVDLSYVYMPRVDSTFKAKYLTNTSYLKYSYEDHFILRSGYTFSYSSVPFGSVSRNYHTWKGSVESAGNLLYLGYWLTGMPKDKRGFYQIGNISFSQYLRGELEYAKSVTLDSRSRLAYRAGIGLAYPFGNSTILPFEKRFYSGGANSVRGWSVRTLGPGSYGNATNKIDFWNQSGDMKIDLSLEYRSNLFSVVEGALFADAGNNWTLRKYSDQPGGQFRLDRFYRELAMSVGAGIRLAFDYFLIRVDAGMKVYDPSSLQTNHWRIRSIDNWDDFAFHFAVGYPF